MGKETAQWTIKKIVWFLNIFITCMVWKKAAVIFNFCLIGNIHHNFLVPRMIESVPETFMPIQTPDLHRVILHTFVSGEKYKSHKTLKQIITSPFSNSIIEVILTAYSRTVSS